MKSKLFFIAVLACLIASQSTAQINPNKYRLQKKVVVTRGAVVSAHPLASKVGVQILKQGGNAVDAAIATQLALAVVYPGAGNIGGGGFLVGHLSKGKNIAIDFREMAPSKANRDMYLDSTGNAQMNLSQDGHLAAAVPGTVAGIFASMKYARLPFKKLIQPAIDLAEHGFAISKSQADDFNEFHNEFKAMNTSPVAFVKFVPWKEGDMLVQLNLAATVKRIRDLGAKGFYEGETARLIVEEMQKGKGIISYEDLKNYKAKERTVTRFTYHGYEIISMPLPSSGGILLQQMLGMIADKNITALKFQTPASVQLMTEAERRAFADRAEFLGDADFVKVPVKTLVNKKYLKERMNDYVDGKAGSSRATGAGSFKESEETTHLNVIDAAGNAVSVTTTLNGHFGSRTVVGGAGFLLNNEMDDFSVKPGVPNMYGALGNEKNAIAPGKRMLSSMTPTIVLKNGKPYLVLGTPGGTTIPTSVFQTIVNIIDFNMSAEDAVNKPKFHHQWLPDVIDMEDDFDATSIAALKAMGYTINKRGSIGRTELIQIKKGKIIAVGDKRGDDAAEGY
ncbi:MAG: gamma-glutamyltransferase [Chitinophagaceae bacterium]|nr:gamma-glutamyltransferase [Chitinophagaceae bacterium]